jgi:hypothetical protein
MGMVAWVLPIIYELPGSAYPAEVLRRPATLRRGQGPGSPQGRHSEVCSDDLLSPSPPTEKTTASKDQARKASTGDGARDRIDGQTYIVVDGGYTLARTNRGRKKYTELYRISCKIRMSREVRGIVSKVEQEKRVRG